MHPPVVGGENVCEIWCKNCLRLKQAEHNHIIPLLLLLEENT